MAKIKILQLISGVAIGKQSGGAEAHALKVANLLPKTDFESAIFCMWRYHNQIEDKWLRQIEDSALPIYGLTNRQGALLVDLKKTFVKLWHAVSHFKPHIVHSHSERGDWLNAMIHRLHPLHPYAIRTVHIDQLWQTHPVFGNIIDTYIFPAVFKHEITISESIRKLLADKSKRRTPQKLSVCYHGLDEAVFQMEKKTAVPLGVPQNTPRIGIVGRLTQQKGHADLLRAMHLIRNDHLIQLIIIGEGSLKDELTKLAIKLKIIDQVHFLGVRNDVLEILAHLDLFVLPSYWEGFPAVLLEAMSQSVPVIASDVSGSRELVHTGQTGILVPPGNPQQLAQAIVKILSMPEFGNELAQRAKKQASQYTLQKMIVNYADVYKHIFT